MFLIRIIFRVPSLHPHGRKTDMTEIYKVAVNLTPFTYIYIYINPHLFKRFLDE